MIQDSAGAPVPDAKFIVSYQHDEEKGSDVNVASHMLIDALTSAVDAVVVLSNDSDLKLPVQHVRSLMPVGLLYPSVSVAGHLLCLGLIALVRVGHARCVENRLNRINSQQRSATCQSPEDGSRADTPTPDPNLLECVSNVRCSYYSPGSLWAGFFFAVEAQHALTHCKRIREPFGSTATWPDTPAPPPLAPREYCGSQSLRPPPRRSRGSVSPQ